MKLHHAALALVIVAGCESQAALDYRTQRAIQRNPPKLTTTASVLTGAVRLRWISSFYQPLA